MTKFIYIADTHMGANPMGYQQQKGYPEKLPEIISALSGLIAADPEISFVLHGGDMLDSTSDEGILQAAKAFSMPVPVYLCLGNHDLTEPDAIDSWLTLAPQFFAKGLPNYTIRTDDLCIHVVPNQWGPIPYYWKDSQDVRFSDEQLTRLSAELDECDDQTNLLVTHSPVYGLPPEQTGFDRPFHSPGRDFPEQISGILASRASVRCVLGAHNHMNMRINVDGTEYITASSLVETPFEFKLFEVQDGQVRMSTLNLEKHLGFSADYDPNRSYVQGRPIDRSIPRE